MKPARLFQAPYAAVCLAHGAWWHSTAQLRYILNSYFLPQLRDGVSSGLNMQIALEELARVPVFVVLWK